jgi:hypothetical protein
MLEQTIKTFEEACAKLGRNPEHLPVVDMLPEKHQKSIVAEYKLITIAEALNDGWEPNWANDNELKYFPYFYTEPSKKKVPSGVGFSFYDYVHQRSRTGVGSRLCYKSDDLATYAGQQFFDLYKEYLLILN